MTEEVVKKTIVEQILDEWQKDAKMDSTEPGQELMKIPVLHSKYVRYLVKNNTRLKATRLELSKLRKFKLDYFNGLLTQEELSTKGLKPFKRILKTEMQDHLEADDEIQAIQRKIILYEETVDLCKSILKQLEQRSYSLTKYIDWQKFLAGN